MESLICEAISKGRYDPHGMLHGMPPHQMWRDRMFLCEHVSKDQWPPSRSFCMQVLRRIMAIEASSGKRSGCVVIADFVDYTFDPSAIPIVTGACRRKSLSFSVIYLIQAASVRCCATFGIIILK